MFVTGAASLSCVVLPVALVVVTVILLALSQQTRVPGVPSLATVRNSVDRAASRGRITAELPALATVHAALRLGQPADNGPSGPIQRGRFRDPLRDHRAIVGRDARTPWYIRVRALLLLLIAVVLVSLAIAGITLLIIASGRFVLEILAG